MQRTKWTDRKFTFDFPEGWLPNILERLKGTTPRLIVITYSLTEKQTKESIDGKWSIRQHIGHLTDLEELHEGRIDDFIAGKKVLRAADMSNAKTVAANHNSKTTDQLIKEFSDKRNQFVARLAGLTDETQYLKSLHPRLQILMRPVDVAYFTAEHDDHHLADINNIILKSRNKK